MENQKTSFVYVTYIAASAEKVFDAITNPEVAIRYWAHSNLSAWEPGSRWEHIDAEGRAKIAGTVIEVTPPTRLVLSWADPSHFADQNKHSRVTFEIAAFDEMVRLTVTHDELELGSGMAMGISKGWPIVLSSLKSFLETGKSLDVFAKPVSARAPAA